MGPLAVKRCVTCDKEFPATPEFFYRNCGAKDGLGSKCKACACAYSREYARAHPEKCRERRSKWRQEHREEIREYGRRYAARRATEPKTPRSLLQVCTKCGAILPATLEYYRFAAMSTGGLRADCRECERKAAKEYANTHKDAVRQRRAMWQEENKAWTRQYAKEYVSDPMVKERVRKWAQERYHTNPVCRLRTTIAACMRQSLKSTKNGAPWQGLVGYRVTELITHLESLFEPGMTWDNYGRGGWEIDHIRPVSSFNFTSPDDPEFKECWALSNLQPLWGHDNRVKSARFPGSEMMQAQAGGSGV